MDGSEGMGREDCSSLVIERDSSYEQGREEYSIYWMFIMFHSLLEGRPFGEKEGSPLLSILIREWLREESRVQ